MNDKRKPKRRILLSLLLVGIVLCAGVFGVAYARGWVAFQQGDGRFTIEVQTGKAKQDTDQAVKTTKAATSETGKALQTAGKKLEKIGEDNQEPTTTTP